jgi:large subunit ribosomal protein L15
MKLHDLRPPAGSHTARTRVGRGIAAGKGKTAGRGTKGQKARAGGSIPPWFEGGQTPLHMRLPKLRGFKNRFKVDYEVVNIGAIAAAAERGAFEGLEPAELAGKSKKAAPATVNQELLRAVGLVRTLKKPLKILGNGELSAALFVVADAFTKSAVSKIEAAGGTVSILEAPTEQLTALGLDGETSREPREARTAEGRAVAARKVDARAARASRAAEAAAIVEASSAANAAKPAKAKAAKTKDAEAPAESHADGQPAVAANVDDAATEDAAGPVDDATAAFIESTDEPAAFEAADEPNAEVETPDDGENA